MVETDKQILALALKNGLEIKEETIKLNESGLDFKVAFATDVYSNNWVLRIPRREDVMAGTSKEKMVLDFVVPRISLQAPRWEIHTGELIAYKLLDGVPAGTIDPVAQAYVWVLDEKNVPDIYNKSLAEAMASLHKVDSVDAKEAGLDVKSAQEIRQVMKERMLKVKAEFGVGESLWNRWQKWIEDESLWPQQTGLTHGDLHPGHILINDKSKVTGFIDWTEASVKDLSIDFVGHYRTLGEENLDKLIKYYKEAGGYVWPRMKEHVLELAASYPVDIAEFALKSGIEEYHEMAKESLEIKST